jgi:hypothetical protein
MGDRVQYIVEVPSGEILWLTYSEKSMLISYNMLNYDSFKGYWFFHVQKRKAIDEILKYERKMVT